MTLIHSLDLPADDHPTDDVSSNQPPSAPVRCPHTRSTAGYESGQMGTAGSVPFFSHLSWRQASPLTEIGATVPLPSATPQTGSQQRPRLWPAGQQSSQPCVCPPEDRILDCPIDPSSFTAFGSSSVQTFPAAGTMTPRPDDRPRRRSLFAALASQWHSGAAPSPDRPTAYSAFPDPPGSTPGSGPAHNGNGNFTTTPASVGGRTPARSFVHGVGSVPTTEPQYATPRVREQTRQLASWLISEPAIPITRAGHTSSSSTEVSNSPETTSFPIDDEHHDRRSSLRVVPPPAGAEQEAIVSTSSSRSARSQNRVFFPDREPLTQRNRRISIKSDNTTASYYYADTPDIENLRQAAQSHEPSHHSRPGLLSSPWYARIFRQSIGSFGFRKMSRQTVVREVVVKPVKMLPAVFLGWLLNVLDALSYGIILFPPGMPIFAATAPDGLSIFFVSCIVSQLVYSCGASKFRGGVGSEMIEVVPFFHKMAALVVATMGPSAAPSAVIATVITSYALSSILTGFVFLVLGVAQLGSLVSFFPRNILTGCIGGVGIFLILTAIQVCGRLDSTSSSSYGMPVGDVVAFEGSFPFHKVGRLWDPEVFAQWTIPLLLAVALIMIKKYKDHEMILPAFFISIVAVFYVVVVFTPSLSLERLRAAGWVFEKPNSDVPFWRFYTYFKFGEVHWYAILRTVPSMFALSFFGVLHVPINVPALAIAVGEDDMNVNRELIAHGISNSLSGLVGSIQNYLVYANSTIFIRNGGNSRLAGIMLALATLATWLSGPGLIGYIPVMMVGALIFYLGIELVTEALWDSYGRSDPYEYAAVVVISLIMGFHDFVVGIVVGIVLVCFIFVLQNSRVSPIRATYSGATAESTVRRHPVHRHFLRRVGSEIYVLKLAGYLFFGSIVAVEDQAKAVVNEESLRSRPIRYLIFDFQHVTGIDFSAAEALCRIDRILRRKGVEMVISSVALDGRIGRSLAVVGLFSSDDRDAPKVFEDLNYALENCENGLLAVLQERVEARQAGRRHSAELDRAGYQPSDSVNQAIAVEPVLRSGMDIPQGHYQPEFDGMFTSLSADGIASTPRRHLLHRVATLTMAEADNRVERLYNPPDGFRKKAKDVLVESDGNAQPTSLGIQDGVPGPDQSAPLSSDEPQPIPVLRQIVLEMGPHSVDPSVWRLAASYFEPAMLERGDVLYSRRERAHGFYMIEHGALRADYALEDDPLVSDGHGGSLSTTVSVTRFSEPIVAGTTCGELPFFANARRSATVVADSDSVKVWRLDRHAWGRMRRTEPTVANELLRLAMRLSAERMANITGYALVLGG